jgi:hypothetical protein
VDKEDDKQILEKGLIEAVLVKSVEDGKTSVSENGGGP